MLEEIFEFKIKIGDLDFEVNGTYIIESDDIEIIFETVLLKLFINNQESIIDADSILTALDGWGKLEESVKGQLVIDKNDDMFVNIDDVDEDDILGDY